MTMETVGVKAVIQGLPEYLRGADAITNANRGISKSLDGLGAISNGFKLLAVAAAGVSAAIGGTAISAAVKYETTLAKIDALTNTTTEDTQKLGKGILALSKVVPKSPDELGAAAYFALSSGITDVDEALALVTAAAKASAAGLGSTADIVDIATAAINAYGPANLDAARAVDILVAAVREGKGEPAQMAAALGTLLPLAAQLKIPFEDLAGIFASLTNSLGGSGAADLAGTQLRGLLSQIISPSKEAKDALAEAEAGVKTLSREQLALADANRAVTSAADGYNSAQRSLRNATESAAKAQRDQNQAVFDARKELLSVAEAEQRLKSLKARAPQQALQEKAAILALADAQQTLNEARRKGNQRDIQRATLDLANAEQRLKEIRVDAPQQALDIQNAELSLAETKSRVGRAAEQQRERERASTEAVADAQRALARSGADLALAQEKQLLAQIHTRDAYADLRKEIQEKGFPATMQRLNELFKDNQEGLAKLFPDVRAFTGFLAAMAQEGEGTARAVDNIRKSTGLTEEVFKRMSETTAAQVSILKNQLNVALITLGSAILPIVNAGLLEANKLFGQASDFFTKGINGTKIGGEFTAVETAAFKAGEKVRELFQFIKDNKDATLLPTGKIFLEGLQTVTEWFIDHKEAIAAVFFLFAASNPIWAGILAGGAIITGIGLLGAAIDDLSDPLLRVRLKVDQLILRLLNAAEQTRSLFLSVGTLGLSNIGPIKDQLDKRPGSQAINNAQADLKNDIKEIEELLRGREIRLSAEAEIQARINRLHEDAVANASTFQDELEREIVQMLVLGGATDGWASRLVDAAATVKGVDPSRIELLRDAIGEASRNAANLKAPPPTWFDPATAAVETANQSVLTLDNSIQNIPEPDVGDAGKKVIDAAAVAAANEKTQLGLIRPPNVGDAGLQPILAAVRAANDLRLALEAAGRAASNVGRSGINAVNNAIRRAEGGVVRAPEFALIGEAGPEAVLPLTDAMRSRQIVSMLSPSFVESIMPRPMADGGFLGLAAGKFDIGSPYDIREKYATGRAGGGGASTGTLGAPAGKFDIGSYFDSGSFPTSTGGGQSTGTLNPPATKQIYATLPPSLVRSMVATRPGEGSSQFDSLFGDVNIGSSSREVEEIAVRTVRSLFSQARTQSAIGGGLLTSGIG